MNVIKEEIYLEPGVCICVPIVNDISSNVVVLVELEVKDIR